VKLTVQARIDTGDKSTAGGEQQAKVERVAEPRTCDEANAGAYMINAAAPIPMGARWT